MDFDISHLLDQWDYQPGQVVVRRFKAKDGKEKLQLRVDLGLLQMNAEGRPDGKRPFGHPSLFDYFQARLFKYVGAHNGSDEGFKLKAEDYTLAIQCVEEGLEKIRAFYHDSSRAEGGEPSAEVQSLESWLEEIRAKRPLSPRERLEQALNDAVKSEDYEKAAQVRDALRNLKAAE